jgi:hypothetical protein
LEWIALSSIEITQKLNQFNGNFQHAEMVKAFIISGEYRRRFGKP